MSLFRWILLFISGFAVGLALATSTMLHGVMDNAREIERQLEINSHKIEAVPSW